ncbi:TetR/AcrR family transcriptional regulator [Rhizobacter sp. P5_C2]
MNLIVEGVQVKERRRGANLEAAILESTWEELIEGGYANLTMEAVATRAGTSRPVLGRRWSNRAELALAAIHQQLLKHPMDVPAGGGVRDELLALMNQATARASALAASILVIFGEYSAATGSSPEAFRTQLVRGETDALGSILARAVARGEIDAAKLKPPVSTVLIDLFRHHVIMNLAAPGPELTTAWVDEVFLPLVRAGQR